MRAVVAWQETPVGLIRLLDRTAHPAPRCRRHLSTRCARARARTHTTPHFAKKKPEKDGVRNVCYDLCFNPGACLSYAFSRLRAHLPTHAHTPRQHATAQHPKRAHHRRHAARRRRRRARARVRRRRRRAAALPARAQGRGVCRRVRARRQALCVGRRRQERRHLDEQGGWWWWLGRCCELAFARAGVRRWRQRAFFKRVRVEQKPTDQKHPPPPTTTTPHPHTHKKNQKGDGILRYGHGEAVTALAYSPATLTLASGAGADFGLWSPEQKAVTKH